MLEVQLQLSQEGSIVTITYSIFQEILKSDNLLYKWGFVDSQLVTTVGYFQSIFSVFLFPSP